MPPPADDATNRAYAMHLRSCAVEVYHALEVELLGFLRELGVPSFESLPRWVDSIRATARADMVTELYRAGRTAATLATPEWEGNSRRLYGGAARLGLGLLEEMDALEAAGAAGQARLAEIGVSEQITLRKLRRDLERLSAGAADEGDGVRVVGPAVPEAPTLENALAQAWRASLAAHCEAALAQGVDVRAGLREYWAQVPGRLDDVAGVSDEVIRCAQRLAAARAHLTTEEREEHVPWDLEDLQELHPGYAEDLRRSREPGEEHDDARALVADERGVDLLMMDPATDWEQWARRVVHIHRTPERFQRVHQGDGGVVLCQCPATLDVAAEILHRVPDAHTGLALLLRSRMAPSGPEYAMEFMVSVPLWVGDTHTVLRAIASLGQFRGAPTLDRARVVAGRALRRVGLDAQHLEFSDYNVVPRMDCESGTWKEPAPTRHVTDLEAALGLEPCRHPAPEWVEHPQGGALCLECPQCGRSGLRVIPRVCLAPGDRLHTEFYDAEDRPAMLRSERFWAVLRGEEPPENLGDARARYPEVLAYLNSSLTPSFSPRGSLDEELFID